jgi:tetratricopeptide (TPR) repeat protein
MINWKISAAVSLLAALASGPVVPLEETPPPFLDPSILSNARCFNSETGSGGLAAFLGAAKAYAQTVPLAAGSAGSLTGYVTRYPVATANPNAQDLFDGGLSLVVSFNHEAGVVMFREAQAADPACAMCYWGEAYALGSNINLYPADEAFRAARAAAEAALARLDGSNSKERTLVEAIAARFPASEDGTVKEDTAAFANAMKSAAAQYPDDNFILSLAAEANMNTQPWDYWEADRHTPKGRTAETIALLETILARDPANVHAAHLYIHATEASSDPWRALPYAEQLPDLAPQSGHLVHMPSHIHLLTGQWRKAIDLNLKAAKADETYLASGDTSLIYRYGYYPHNLHFVLVAAQMAGDDKTAIEVARKLDAALPGEMTGTAPWVALIKPAPYYAHAQFSPAADIIALPEPMDVDSVSKAGWHYARGVAYAELGDLDKAEAEAQRIEALLVQEDIAALEAAFVPAATILTISIRTVEARIAAKSGDLKRAISLMETAADMQDRLPYSEPALWYYPARQTLAAFLLADGQLERAEKIFQRTLLDTPNNAYALYGLWQTYKAQGDTRSAKYAKALYKKAWMGGGANRPALHRI